MAARTLDTLFHEFLKDIYHVETRTLRTLPRLAEGARSLALAVMIDGHRERTQEHARRLDAIFAMIGKRPECGLWAAGDAIVDQGLELLQHYQSSPALDSALMAAMQALEEHEIARYGALKRWAAMLGLNEAATLIEATLQEERQASAALGALADWTLTAAMAPMGLDVETMPAAVLLPAAA